MSFGLASRQHGSHHNPQDKRSTRIVVLPDDALTVLEAHRQRQLLEHAAMGIETDQQTYIFTSEVGTLMGVRNFSRTFTRLQTKAGVTRIRLHDLRHLRATLLVAHGIDLRTVADRLGHADPAFTLRTYSHVLDRNRVAAAIGLDDLLHPEAPERRADQAAERLPNYHAHPPAKYPKPGWNKCLPNACQIKQNADREQHPRSALHCP